MVLGIISAVTGAVGAPLSMVAVPTSAVATSTSVVGVAQTASSQQSGQQNKSAASDEPETDLANDPRLAKFTLTTQCSSNSSRRDQVDGKQVVLRNGKLYLDELDPANRRFPDGHPFSGFYLEYPSGSKPVQLGLVSTISVDPPELNWIYVDTTTLELKYGNKTRSLPHIVAPWDWTDDRESLTLEEWEGFVALEESRGTWVLCYDREDNHLSSVRGNRRVLECSLERKVL